MKNKKKVIGITLISVVVLIIAVGFIFFFTNQNSKTSKTMKLYNTLVGQNSYNFITTLDKNNIVHYAKKDDNIAYLDMVYKGEESKFVIRDGNSYLLRDLNKVYYTYQNDDADLNKIEAQFEKLKDLEVTTGSEKIDNKNYQYEEYAIETDFLLKYFEDNEKKNVKTRFYYAGNQLVYIKTIVGDYQEILKVDISYEVDNNLFEIPSDYQEA